MDSSRVGFSVLRATERQQLELVCEKSASISGPTIIVILLLYFFDPRVGTYGSPLPTSIRSLLNNHPYLGDLKVEQNGFDVIEV